MFRKTYRLAGVISRHDRRRYSSDRQFWHRSHKAPLIGVFPLFWRSSIRYQFPKFSPYLLYDSPGLSLLNFTSFGKTGNWFFFDLTHSSSPSAEIALAKDSCTSTSLLVGIIARRCDQVSFLHAFRIASLKCWSSWYADPSCAWIEEAVEKRLCNAGSWNCLHEIVELEVVPLL